MDIMTPTKARKELYSLIEAVNSSNEPTLITGGDRSKSAYLLGVDDYETMQEMVALAQNGQFADSIAHRDDLAEGDVRDLLRKLDENTEE